jgi:hypothetical protein
MREKVIGKKKPCEQYFVTFDYRNKKCFEPHERIRKVTVGAFDLTDDRDVSKYFLDPSKQNIDRRQIFLWVREGLIGHVYRVWCHVAGSKGTRWENAMEILVEGDK